MNLLPPVSLLDLFVSVPIEGEQAPSPFQELLGSLESAEAPLSEPSPLVAAPAQPLIEADDPEIVQEPVSLQQELERASVLLQLPLVVDEAPPPPPAAAPMPPQASGMELSPEPSAPPTPSGAQLAPIRAEAPAPPEVELPTPQVEVLRSQVVPARTAPIGVSQRPEIAQLSDKVLRPARPDVPEGAPREEAVAREPVEAAEAAEAPISDAAPRPVPGARAKPAVAPRPQTPVLSEANPASVEPQLEESEAPAPIELLDAPVEVNDLEVLHDLGAPLPREVQLKLDEDLELTVRRDGEEIEVLLDGTPEAIEPLLEIGPELRDELARSGFELSDFRHRERERQPQEAQERSERGPEESSKERESEAREGRGARRRARRTTGLVDLSA